MNYMELYNKYVGILENSGFKDAKSDVLTLIYDVFSFDFSSWTLEKSETVKDTVKIDLLDEYIKKRLKNMPIQYILKKTYFCGFPMYVDENVLIPRYDTEILVEEVIRLSGGNRNLRILDMCTGSGAVAIALQKLGGFLEIDALDICDKAIDIAKNNAKKLECNINIFKSDMFSSLTSENKYDIIVSNPPYIRSQVVETLDEEVKDFEPRIALDGSGDGLKFYNIIRENFTDYIKKDGILAMEIGYDQGNDIRNIFKNSGKVFIKKDLANLDRVAVVYT